MSVWCALPSIRPAAAVEPVLEKWKDKGYKVALLRSGELVPGAVDMQIPEQLGEYQGWTTAINFLTALILDYDPQAEWIVAGGDDLLPDRRPAADIARACNMHFGLLAVRGGVAVGGYLHSTLGVMQPTGDRYVTPGSTLPYPDVEHSACSPWLGREFCERAYKGNGPMWPGYRHYWGDNELQEVAKKLGCFWQSQDLTQLHQHWSRDPDAACPEHLRAAHEGGAEMDRLLFETRKAAGFPGHELKA